MDELPQHELHVSKIYIISNSVGSKMKMLSRKETAQNTPLCNRNWLEPNYKSHSLKRECCIPSLIVFEIDTPHRNPPLSDHVSCSQSENSQFYFITMLLSVELIKHTFERG